MWHSTSSVQPLPIATLGGMPPGCYFSDPEGAFPIGRELAICLPSFTSHSPNEISFLEASRSDLRVVLPGWSEFARCFVDFALVLELV